MKTAYEERTIGSPYYPPPNADVTFLTNMRPKLRRKIVVTFDRREGIAFALRLIGHALRHPRWSFFVEHEEAP